jgi:membrane-associated phospholipid phosphatase
MALITIISLLLIGGFFINRCYLGAGYFLGFVINIILNVFLKWVFCQPRPNTDISWFKTALSINKNNAIFIATHCGMPSGHAQMSGFALSYIILSTHAWWMWAFITLLTIAICLQRIITNVHTPLQILVGLFVGMTFGWLCYIVMVRFLKLKYPQGVFPKSCPFGSIL